MNAPDRMDAVRVPAGVPKVAMTADEKVVNAAMYCVAREDHTLGNLLRMELLRDPAVRFVGYKHPHPLDNDIVLRIQTAGGAAAHTPTAALAGACRRLEDELRSIQSSFSSMADAKRREQQEL